MRGKTIGDQELALLQYIDEHAPATVGEVASGYGEARGLARSTVLTMMERLRAKGYLQRQQVSDNELAELEALVAQLQSRRHEG